MKIFNSNETKVNRSRLRHNMPLAEILLWKELKDKQIDNMKFRRQASIGKYIVDFYCPMDKIIIEVDGDSHYLSPTNRQYDQERDKYLDKLHCKVIRFKNSDIYNNMEGVLNTIKNYQNHPYPSLERRGE